MTDGNIIISEGNVEKVAREHEMAQRVAEALTKHYPGHLWAVHVTIEGNTVSVKNLYLSGQWGFILRYDALCSDPDMKQAMRAGGELLERYKLQRGAFNADDYLSKPEELGRLRPEL